MALLRDDIGAILEGGGLGLTLATNLFLEYMPDSPAPDAAVAIYTSGGEKSDKGFGPTIAARNETFQIKSRGSAEGGGADVAMNKAVQIHDYLDGKSFTVGATTYDFIEARQPPANGGRDENGRPLVFCNFQIRRAV